MDRFPMKNTRQSPLFFSTGGELRLWFEKNHDRSPELWLGLYKAGAGEQGITMEEAQALALCFGWAEGIRASMDAQRYVIRFCPRRPGKGWSQQREKQARELMALGLMHPAGIQAFERRNAAASSDYTTEINKARLTAAWEKEFRRHAKAWTWFQASPASYRKAATWWVIRAKLEATRRKRFEILLADSASGRRIKSMRRPGREALK